VTPRFSIRPWGYTRRAVDGFIERLYAATKMLVVDARTETSRLEAANLKLDQELAEIERETTGLQEREAKVARAIADSRSRASQMMEESRLLASQMLANARDDLDRRRDEAMAAERGFRSLTFVLESLLQQAAGVSDRPGTVPDRTARRQ
jgi:cell division septum initiation protein DivIVA